MNRTDFQLLADVRIAEAKALLDQGMFAGAYYLAGYCVECALKACIAKLTNQFDFADKKFVQECHTHNLEKLLELSGLKKERDSGALADQEFFANWQVINLWKETSRYAQKSQLEAQQLYDAITDVSHGVMPWIKQRW
ncbi:MAG: HEPN domain-containing protein [Gemmataceae bacterium]|nr:HEPN domain-containing protein [Gemmataceae bacterium]MCI0743249.1 HEPN domain-containing protein [Gemmataceae bacterium]